MPHHRLRERRIDRREPRKVDRIPLRAHLTSQLSHRRLREVRGSEGQRVRGSEGQKSRGRTGGQISCVMQASTGRSLRMVGYAGGGIRGLPARLRVLFWLHSVLSQRVSGRPGLRPRPPAPIQPSLCMLEEFEAATRRRSLLSLMVRFLPPPQWAVPPAQLPARLPEVPAESRCLPDLHGM
jgi:hypothetical protein